MSSQGIKTMKLYDQVERVFNELAELGIPAGAPIDVTQLTAFDQYHYLGTEAVDEAIHRLGLSPRHEVLEIGSGIGGPARHLAHACGCHVTALELQPDLDATAVDLTGRCGLADRVQHRCGNVLDGLPRERYHAVVSWLTFLHISQRPRLYALCHEALRPGGGLYVEDYFLRGPLSAHERERLAVEVYCDYVPDLQTYRADLEAAGFEDVELVDMSGSWSAFVQERLSAFRASGERHRRVHGDAIVDGLESFYLAVAELFAGGNLGGLRLVARKPG